MTDVVILRQLPPVVMVRDAQLPVVISSGPPQSVIVSREGVVIQNNTGPVTEITETTEVPDPGDLTLLFENKLI